MTFVISHQKKSSPCLLHLPSASSKAPLHRIHPPLIAKVYQIPRIKGRRALCYFGAHKPLLSQLQPATDAEWRSKSSHPQSWVLVPQQLALLYARGGNKDEYLDDQARELTPSSITPIFKWLSSSKSEERVVMLGHAVCTCMRQEEDEKFLGRLRQKKKMKEEDEEGFQSSTLRSEVFV